MTTPTATATKTAAERIQDTYRLTDEVLAQQELNRQAYHSAVSVADAKAMAAAKHRAVDLEKQKSAYDLQVQELLCEDAVERLAALGTREETVQESLREVAGPLQAIALKYTELTNQSRALEAEVETIQRQKVEVQTFLERSRFSLDQMRNEATARF